jgi:hypothetical protein
MKKAEEVYDGDKIAKNLEHLREVFARLEFENRTYLKK